MSILDGHICEFMNGWQCMMCEFVDIRMIHYHLCVMWCDVLCKCLEIYRYRTCALLQEIVIISYIA